jgi:predicted dehydrogenase
VATPLRVAVVGVGRIGRYHARHLQELARERGDCRLVAVVDRHGDTAAVVAAELQSAQDTPIVPFGTPDDLVSAGLADAAVVASRTEDHLRDTRALVAGGLRVLLEKPLAGTLEEAVELGAWLDEDDVRARAVMLAFQRRYDPAMRRARGLLRDGAIGELFKIESALEDPLPPPAGYQSPGLLADMAVHNVDEILWLTGRLPTAIAGLGARVHNQRLPAVTPETFDDVFLQMWMGADVVAQLQVSRNHVAGYRNECVLLGRKGRIHVGHFEGDRSRVRLEVTGVDHEVIERGTFELRDYGENHGEVVPPFIQRFGPAYKAEAFAFLDACLAGDAFEVGHPEGLIAMRIAMAGAEVVTTGSPIRLS